MKLNLPRRTKRRLPTRIRQPLAAPSGLNQIWALDFMADALYGGRAFRTLNLIEELDVTPLGPSLNILCSLPKEAAGIPLMITTEFVPKVAVENLTLVLMQSARSELGWC